MKYELFDLLKEYQGVYPDITDKLTEKEFKKILDTDGILPNETQETSDDDLSPVVIPRESV